MKKEEIVDEMIERTLKIFQILHQKNHDLAVRLGITLEQFHLLLEIHEMIDEEERKGFPSIGEIARRINNPQNTLSEKLTRMEKKNIIKRFEDKEDRRINRVMLTEEGHRILHEIEDEATKNFLRKIFLKMEDEYVKSFSGNIVLLEKELSKRNYSI